MGEKGQREVRRRRVFYVPGYDPLPPRRYRELYRREGAAQAAISGHELSLSPLGRGGWRVQAVVEGREVLAEVEVLTWSDIVQGSMSGSILATYGQLVRTAWLYMASGALWRLMRLRKGPVIAALYPVAMLLLQLLAAVGLGALAAGLAAWALGVAAAGPPFWGWAARIVVGVPVAWAVLRWFKRRDGRLFAHYLMHDYAFGARHRGANPPALEARMRGFAEAIGGALEGGWDEVLVVGHSSGAHLALSVLADLIRDGRARPGGPALGLLTLGQVVPMVSFLPDAHRLRADLAFLSTREELAWVDVTAPGDGCAFALCDPVAVTGVRPKGARGPLVLSAAFTQTLSPERWRALRWRFFRLHFQYLCAFDRPGAFDYFRITAGPLTLRDRFAGRASSRGRIAVAASGYTSVAA